MKRVPRTTILLISTWCVASTVFLCRTYANPPLAPLPARPDSARDEQTNRPHLFAPAVDRPGQPRTQNLLEPSIEPPSPAPPEYFSPQGTLGYPPEPALSRFDRQLLFAGPQPDAIAVRHHPVKIEWDPLNPSPLALPAFGCDARTAVFDTPAEFPMHGFTPLGGAFAMPGAVIYEGMTVTTDASGRFEVRYVVESPKTPVVLRLQLVLHQDARPVGKVTLPPVTIVVDSDSPVQIPSTAYLIRQEGFSHQLSRLFAADPIGERTSIVRVGTARFGGVPE